MSSFIVRSASELSSKVQAGTPKAFTSLPFKPNSDTC